MSDSGQMHAIDIRWPIGVLFAAMGLTLVIYGAAEPSFGSVVPLRINLDVWWGLALVLFGALMIWGAWLSDRRTRQQPPDLPQHPLQDESEAAARKAAR
jgi:type VI protein secretion system component VasK